MSENSTPILNFKALPRFAAQQFRIVTLIPEWAAAYEVEISDIERQLPIAHAWCNANPRKAPKSDPVRFLWNWMRFAKKHGNLVSRKVTKPALPPPEPDMTFDEMIEIRKRNMGLGSLGDYKIASR